MTLASSAGFAVAPVVLAALLLVVSPRVTAQEADGGSGTDAAHDHGHDHEVPDLLETPGLSRQQKARIERLFGLVVCKCPNEKWTLSLAGCPNACARQQQEEIRDAVSAGKSDGEILAAQERRYGPMVLARPPAKGLGGFWLYAMPFVFFGAFVLLLVVVLQRVIRPSVHAGASTASGEAPEAPLSDADRQLDERIERELEEMD